MVRPRTGSSTLGCLFVLLLLSAAGYFAVNVGEVYFRFYQFQDGMRQEVRFASHNSSAARKSRALSFVTASASKTSSIALRCSR